MFINSIYHAYDIPSFIFLLCMPVFAFLNKNILFFISFFAIATLNRESTCFITVSLFFFLSKFKTLITVLRIISK